MSFFDKLHYDVRVIIYSFMPPESLVDRFHREGGFRLTCHQAKEEYDAVAVKSMKSFLKDITLRFSKRFDIPTEIVPKTSLTPSPYAGLREVTINLPHVVLAHKKLIYECILPLLRLELNRLFLFVTWHDQWSSSTITTMTKSDFNSELKAFGRNILEEVSRNSYRSYSPKPLARIVSFVWDLRDQDHGLGDRTLLKIKGGKWGNNTVPGTPFGFEALFRHYCRPIMLTSDASLVGEYRLFHNDKVEEDVRHASSYESKGIGNRLSRAGMRTPPRPPTRHHKRKGRCWL